MHKVKTSWKDKLDRILRRNGDLMAKILIAEDDSALRTVLSKYLTMSGFEIKECSNGNEALAAFFEGSYDMVISDIMMPGKDGFELAAEIRGENKSIPILFMSARDDKPAKIYGYQIGIDDYVTKPFDMDVLVMKVTALLRRAKIESNKEITIGNLTMNTEERSALIDGCELALTAREFDILFKLISYPKKTFTRSALMTEFWDYDSSATSRTVDVYMAKLREKTKAATGFTIETVHGLGYKVVLR